MSQLSSALLATQPPNLDDVATRQLCRPKDPVKRRTTHRAVGEFFFARGFERTSMDAGGEVAGVSKDTVYPSLDGKEALFRSGITQEAGKAS